MQSSCTKKTASYQDILSLLHIPLTWSWTAWLRMTSNRTVHKFEFYLCKATVVRIPGLSWAWTAAVHRFVFEDASAKSLTATLVSSSEAIVCVIMRRLPFAQHAPLWCQEALHRIVRFELNLNAACAHLVLQDLHEWFRTYSTVHFVTSTQITSILYGIDGALLVWDQNSVSCCDCESRFSGTKLNNVAILILMDFDWGHRDGRVFPIQNGIMLTQRFNLGRSWLWRPKHCPGQKAPTAWH